MRQMTSNHIFLPLIDRAAAEPDQTFCFFWQNGDKRIYSIGEILRGANAYAKRLTTLGLRRGEIVVIMLGHSPDLYASFIGCVLAGLVPTFMPPPTRKQDPVVFARSMAAVLARIGPAAAITQEAMVPVLESAEIPLLFTDDTATRVDAGNMRAQASLTSVDGVAFLQHSSGTTGLKKGVMLSHRAVLAQARTYSDAIGIVPGDIVASWLPLYHDMGLFTSFIIPAIVGSPIVSLDAMEWVMRPTMLLDAISEHKAAFCWQPNFAFHHIARLDNGRRAWNLSSLKGMISCSEPCRVSAFDIFLETYSRYGLRPEKLGVSYALAENSFAATQTRLGVPVKRGTSSVSRPFLSCGPVVRGTKIEIRPHESQQNDDDGSGEIFIAGHSLFDGYFREPDLTRERLRDGWYRTGDIGRIENGELFVLGRVDDLLIINGKNIFAHEIEDGLNSVDGLAQGRVLAHSAYNDESGGSDLIILAETTDSAPVDALSATLRSRVFSLCGVYPREVHLLPRGYLLKSTSGKIARAASFDKFRSGAQGDQ